MHLSVRTRRSHSHEEPNHTDPPRQTHSPSLQSSNNASAALNIASHCIFHLGKIESCLEPNFRDRTGEFDRLLIRRNRGFSIVRLPGKAEYDSLHGFAVRTTNQLRFSGTDVLLHFFAD